MRALTHYNFGAGFDAEGDVANALAPYRMAVALDPAYAEARNNLGALLSREGETEEARFTSAKPSASIRASPMR